MPKRRPVFDEFSIIIGILLAVFAQSLYDTFRTYYQLNYSILGPYFPSAWAGVVTGLIIASLYYIRRRWRQLFTVAGEDST